MRLYVVEETGSTHDAGMAYCAASSAVQVGKDETRRTVPSMILVLVSMASTLIWTIQQYSAVPTRRTDVPRGEDTSNVRKFKFECCA